MYESKTKTTMSMEGYNINRRRSHIMTDDTSRKCFLNSILFLNILTFSFLNSVHDLGKLIMGCLDKVVNLVNGIF